MTTWHCPEDTDLSLDPDLTAIVLLDAALVVSIKALHAFVPELHPNSSTWSDSTPLVLAARQLVVHASFLRDLIDDYRHKLVSRQASFGPPDDDPF